MEVEKYHGILSVNAAIQESLDRINESKRSTAVMATDLLSAYDLVDHAIITENNVPMA